MYIKYLWCWAYEPIVSRDKMQIAYRNLRCNESIWLVPGTGEY